LDTTAESWERTPFAQVVSLEEVEKEGVEFVVAVDDAQKVARVALGEDGENISSHRLQ
jgi:hypothetical protein